MPAPIVAAAGKAVAVTGKVVAKTAATVAKAASQVAAKVGAGVGKAAATTAKSAGQATAKTTSSVAKSVGQAGSSTAKAATQNVAKGATNASQSPAKAPSQKTAQRSTGNLQQRAQALKQKQKLAQATTTLADGISGLIKAYGNAATGHGIDGTMKFEKINGSQGPQWNAEVKQNGDTTVTNDKGETVAEFNVQTKEIKQPLSSDNAQAFVAAGKAYHAQKTRQPKQQSKARSIARRRQKQIQV